MRVPGWLIVTVLVIAAMASSLALWTLYKQDEPAPLTGPPRSDYFLVDFELVALNEAGKESFSVSGPLLSRHPTQGTIDIENPRFVFPDENGNAWTASAHHGWAASDGGQLRLTGNVMLDSPEDGAQATAFQSESLTVFPKERRATSEEIVTFTSPSSILRGRGLEADMQTRRFQLLNEVTGHYDSPAASTRQ